MSKEKRKDTFDLFLDNRRGASELIRQTAPKGETVVELDLETSYLDLYLDLRYFAFLGGPIMRRESVPSTGYNSFETACVVLTLPREESSRIINQGASALFADIRAKKIICFLNDVEPGNEDQWRREGLWPLN